MLQPYTPDDLQPPAPFPEVYGHTPQRSLLERVLAPLDWGRQAVVGAGEGLGEIGKGNLLTGAAKLLPAIGGIGAGLLGGPLVGTGVASLLQGLGGDVAPETFDSMGTQDLVRKLGGDPESTWQNLGVGAVTDPWMYALGGMGLAEGTTRAGQIGERVGARAGAKAGRWLEQAQLARGPRYPTTPAELLRILQSGHGVHGGEAALDLAGEFAGMEGQPIRRSALSSLASEVPPGSRLLGRPTADGVTTLRTPDGVIKISMRGDGYGGPELGRPISEGLVQPYRSVMTSPRAWDVPLVEHMPYATPLPETETEAGMRKLNEYIHTRDPSHVRPPGTPPGAARREALGLDHFLSRHPSAEETALDEMIRASHYNDMGPRLVKADWLEEAGRPMDALRLRHAAEVQQKLIESGITPGHWFPGSANSLPERFGMVAGEPKFLSPGMLEAPERTDALNRFLHIQRVQSEPGFLDSMYAMDPDFQRSPEYIQEAIDALMAEHVPRQPVIMRAEPTALQSRLLESLGGDARLQAALAEGHQNTWLPEVLAARGKHYGGRGMSVIGGLLGGGTAAALPIAARGGLGY